MYKDNLNNKVKGLLGEALKPLRMNEIAKVLKIKSDQPEYQELKLLLKELVAKNTVSKSKRKRYTMIGVVPSTIFEGVLKISNNYGVVRTDNPGMSGITIKHRDLNTALDGDKVRVAILGSKSRRSFNGEIVGIVERKKSKIVGTLDFDGNFYFLIPDEAKYYVDFLIPKESLKGAKDGDKVAAKFVVWDDPHKSPQAKVTGILGKAGIPKVEFESVAEEMGLPMEFPVDVLAEAERLKHPRNLKSFKNRADLRNELIVTIDPHDAKDFDDALSLRMLDNGNYYLGVHIADVSNYVKENSILDNEARFRATSVYLVDRVIPMIPERLSNEICSLKPNEVRFAFSVFIEFNKIGTPVNYDIKESVIRSRRRYAYEEVLYIIETNNNGNNNNNDNDNPAKIKKNNKSNIIRNTAIKDDNTELILSLHRLSEKLKKRRLESGGINFSTSEVKFTLNDEQYPVDVELKTTTKSTSLVEECMLAANQIVAGHVKAIEKKHKLKMELPFIYRIHEDPDPKRISEAVEFVNSLGYHLPKKNVKSKDINRLMKQIKGKPEESLINQVLIRSMAKAIYTTDNVGHFGLGFDAYTHFTSPIRRYPDLLVHRLLKEYSKGRVNVKRIKDLRLQLKFITKHSTEKEKLAMEAERASNKLTHAVMAKDHVGKVFDGTISGVVAYGLYVLVDGLYAEGLLHIKDLIGDYYLFDEKHYKLVGRRSKQAFSLGGRIKVKLVKVNIEKRNIDFTYVKS